MSIKTQLILPTINLVRELVGSALSQSRAAGNTTIPSVIQARGNTPVPDFPYASISYQNTRKVGVSDRHQYLDDNLDEVTEIDSIVKLVVRFHGSEEDDVLFLANNFEGLLQTTRGKRLLRDNYTNASFLKASGVSFFPALMITDFEEESRISLDFWTRNIIVDSTTGVIERVNLNGELYDDFGQAQPPLDLNIEAP